jgi:hypothetical protein
MANAVEDQIRPLMNQAFEQLADERVMVLEDVNRQRTETQAFVRGERQQVVEAIANERTSAIDSIESLVKETMMRINELVAQQSAAGLMEVDRQRVETINTLREERLETIREMDRLAEEIVESFYARIWLVLGATWVGIAALIVLARWLFRGRKTV